MNVIYDPKKQKVPIKSWCKDIEESAMMQAVAMANHPAAFKHVALMPDAHTGMGVPIGGVWALRDAISPASVGVDIGCGMCAVNTGYKIGKIQGKIKSIIELIKNHVPVGFSHRTKESAIDIDSSGEIDKLIDEHIEEIDILEKKTSGKVCIDSVYEQIGTMGGNNHFIEGQKDQDNYIWVMIHSGSRNIGKQIADVYNKIALESNLKWHSSIPNKSLAFLPYNSEMGQEYYKAMKFALRFAFYNRKVMMMIVSDLFKKSKLPWPDDWQDDMINIHHNYASMENHFGKNVLVHRKGATLARKGVVGIIPGSMGTSSYIVEGLGNNESFHSCSHGAGRKMSRSQAKKTITMSSFKHKMRDIEYEPTKDNLDEAPQAYKDIDDVMEQQKDLVKIITKLTPIAVVKG